VIFTKALIQCDVCQKVAPAVVRVDGLGNGFNFLTMGNHGAKLAVLAEQKWHVTEQGCVCSDECIAELTRAVEQLEGLPVKVRFEPHKPGDNAIPTEYLRYLGKDV
jgi:hypothetical protein